MTKSKMMSYAEAKIDALQKKAQLEMDLQQLEIDLQQLEMDLQQKNNNNYFLKLLSFFSIKKNIIMYQINEKKKL